MTTSPAGRPPFKIVVLDDDPTGSQTVHSCPLLLRWDRETLLEGLRHPSPLLFLLANTRALDADAARERLIRICAVLGPALREAENQGWIAGWQLVSRGDSTLRGHYPLEVELLAAELGPFDATLLAPAFLEGGRSTREAIHRLNGQPVHETPFARDGLFGYRHSDLRAWVEEKSRGRIPAAAVRHLSLRELEGPEPALRARLAALDGNVTVAVDAERPAHLQALAGALRQLSAPEPDPSDGRPAAVVRCWEAGPAEGWASSSAQAAVAGRAARIRPAHRAPDCVPTTIEAQPDDAGPDPAPARDAAGPEDATCAPQAAKAAEPATAPQTAAVRPSVAAAAEIVDPRGPAGALSAGRDAVPERPPARPRRFLIQSAAGLVGALAALPPQPLDAAGLAGLRRRNSDGAALPGLVLVGSHVPLADQQLERLLADPRCRGLELPVDRLLRVLEGPLADPLLASLEADWRAQLQALLESGNTPVLYTSRGERRCRHHAERRALGLALAGLMARLGAALAPRLGYLISKGGITTQTLLADGLELASAELQGQLLPGLSLVLAGPQALPVLTFPGNLGSAETLWQAWRQMEDGGATDAAPP